MQVYSENTPFTPQIVKIYPALRESRDELSFGYKIEYAALKVPQEVRGYKQSLRPCCELFWRRRLVLGLLLPRP